MEVKTKLQNPFNYNEKITSIILIIGVLIIVITVLTYLIIKYKKQISRFFHKLTNHNLKDYYLKKINALENKFNDKKISLRDASIELSKLVRNYIYDMDNIDLLTLSANEIKNLNMPDVYEIISNLYNPEFARLSNKEISIYFDKAKKVISK